jgi:hypothetical protein
MSASSPMLSDDRIKRLLQEGKPNFEPRSILKAFAESNPKHGHRRLTRRFRGDKGTAFALHLRQSTIDPYDFSVILAFEPLTGGGETILRRHNGRGHAHRNEIEGTRLPSTFHVHMATERYQQHGHDIDGYAEATTDFDSLATGLDEMLRVAHFKPPAQPSLWHR